MEAAGRQEYPESLSRHQQGGVPCGVIPYWRGTIHHLKGETQRQRKTFVGGSLPVDKDSYLDRLVSGNSTATAHGTWTRAVASQTHHRNSAAASRQESGGQNPLDSGIRWSEVQQAGRQGGKRSGWEHRHQEGHGVIHFTDAHQLNDNRGEVEKGQTLVQDKERGKTT